MNKVIFTAGLFALVSLTGCAAYRTNSDLAFDSTEVDKIDSSIRIIENDLVDTPYTVIGPIVAIVRKLTVFHPSPTRRQVDAVLVHNARIMGADAVIDVSYRGGVGFSTWGYLEARGTAVKTGTGPGTNASGVADAREGLQYMGLAEEEATTKTYDRNLWSKALVDVDGDETRRKARYIELRARQIYLEKGGSVSVTGQYQQPAIDNSGSRIQVAGKYRSEITSNSKWAFIKRFQDLELTITQSGDSIKAVDRKFNTRISGTIEGSVARFYVLPGSASGFYGATGAWSISADGKELAGTWQSDGNPDSGSGTWKLTRIE